MGQSVHQSIMVEQVLHYLNADVGGLFLDCTLGGGGHSEAILKAHPENRVVAIDRDSRAIQRATQRLDCFSERFQAQKGAFSDLPKLLSGLRFDGVFADLGISSDQLEEQRGFSFNDTSPLDMRMDESLELSAYDVVNSFEASALFKVLKQGGVGKEARKIVDAIVQNRPLETTDSLTRCVHQVCGEYAQGSIRKNSATLVFQAVRMAVNKELEEIEALLRYSEKALVTGGRFVTLCFHSLEDKAITRQCRKWAAGGEYSALWKGSAPEQKSAGRFLTKKAEVPTKEEIKNNPRARSTRLRAFEFN